MPVRESELTCGMLHEKAILLLNAGGMIRHEGQLHILQSAQRVTMALARRIVYPSYVWDRDDGSRHSCVRNAHGDAAACTPIH